MQSDVSTMIVRRMATIFSNIFRIFLIVNGVVMTVAIMNVIQSPLSAFRFHFWVFFIIMAQFWLMSLLFFLISISLKVVFYISVPQTGENPTWLQTLMLFPMNGDGDDEIMELIMTESMNTPQPSRNPPTTDRLLKINLDWGESINIMTEMTDEEKKEKCLICLQAVENDTTNIHGVVNLACMCHTVFHKKCILEWFHFNEKDIDGSFQVSCPSCRFVFTKSS